MEDYIKTNGEMESDESLTKDKSKTKTKDKLDRKQIDWMITLVPLGLIVTLAVLFVIYPLQSNHILGRVRFFFGDTLGSYYLIIGLGFFIVSIVLAFSKYGNIVLGGSQSEKPKYSFFAWGSMMFTCGLAADILFYSFNEWAVYATNPHMKELGNVRDWVSVFPLFHWSLIPWAFYLVLAVAFGFMLHVRKRNRQRFSESCRPVLGKKTDGILGRFIDLLSVFALLAGTATTFSVATPLMATIIGDLFGLTVDRRIITVVILLITCAVYTYSLLHGLKGISILAKACIYLFFSLLAFVFIFGGELKFTIENGLQSLGLMTNHFFELATFTDPTRTTNFPQDWTIYYWAYWMVWCVCAPFFIGTISRGRTIRQTIIGGYVFGVGSTLLSFIILGNYGLGKSLHGGVHFVENFAKSGDMYSLVMDILHSMPLSGLVLVLVIVTMIMFYATSFDSIAYIASCYSYKKLDENQKPHKSIQLMWCILLIILPIGLLFSESSMGNIQTVSIIAAFPLGFVMALIVCSFFKDAKQFIVESDKKSK